MKKELRHILENGLYQELEKYLNENKNLDYIFGCKFGDYSISLNPLLFCLFFKQDLAKLLIKKLDGLEIKDFLSNIPHPLKLDSIFSNPKFDKSELTVLFQHLSNEQKNSISSHLSSLPLEKITQENLKNFVNKKDIFNKIILEDDAHSLVTFIDENPNFDYLGKNNKNSYLLTCVQHNLVFCFDIIKDHIKSIKLNSKKLKL